MLLMGSGKLRERLSLGTLVIGSGELLSELLFVLTRDVVISP
jgi:hypothetical protein